MSLKNVLLRTINRKNKVNIASAALKFYHAQRSQSDQEQQYRHYGKVIAAALVGSVFLAKYLKDKVHNESQNEMEGNTENNNVDEDFEAGDLKPGLPVYRAEEIAKHNSINDFWVIYRHGVYDVTKFLHRHPGGDQIMSAAGFSVEPFWNVYGMHKTKDIYQLLETYRIGNLHDDDLSDYSNEELWKMEPVRDRRLIVKTKRPFNAETPPKLIVENFDTPNELFYVRQHMPVPELDANSHILEITIDDCKGTRTREFNLQELVKLFPQGQVRATLMCAGNRRREMHKVKAVAGLDWQHGAVSNAVWSGVYLRDVLEYCGLDTINTAGKHITFTGADIDVTGVNFSASIPLDQALNPNGQILLATHMNGEVLPKDHGYPLRVIVPGTPAFRSVKWLESPSHWHQGDYKTFNPSETWKTADFSTALPLYSLPVTSNICDPADGDVCTVKNGVIQVRGYAFSGGGNKILRVDVSPDCGTTWYEAEEYQRDDEPPTRHYAWTLWTARIPVKCRQKEINLWVKATDNNFNTQPENFYDIWNIRGLIGNAYHKIKVQIKR